MRLIDADALLEKIDTEREILVKDGRLGTEHILVHYVREFVETAPTVDIVRCRDCRHWDANDSMGAFCWCDFSEDRRASEDFCSYGEVKHETD